MKTKIKAFLLASLLSGGASATVLTVNNEGGAQYGSLQLALDSASNGDTLLVQGSPVSYNADNGNGWNKNLVVIGTGFNSPKQVFNPTSFNLSSAYNVGGTFAISGVGSSKFYGIRFLRDVIAYTNLNNLVFEGCLFEQKFAVESNYNFTLTLAISNTVFKNCVFRNTNTTSVSFLGYANSVVFTHCIFGNMIIGNSNTNIYNVTFEHCVFLANSGNYFGGVSNAIINNSIFYGNASINSTASAFNNCCSLIATTGWNSNGNIANNCLNAVDPLFVNAPVGSTYNNSLSLQLQASSAAIGAATDGTDLGLYGGVSHFSNYGEPNAVPVVRQMNIQNMSVPTNGNVNVKVRSTKAR